MTKGGSFKNRLSRWFDEWEMAFSGIVLATRDWRFLLTFAISFTVFGTVMNLLSGSTAALDLFWRTDFGGKMSIIGDGFLSIFGVGRNFADWILLFLLTILQSTLIGLVVVAWQHKRRNKKAQVLATAKNANNIQDAGIAAGLAILGSGCPTCGTTLLAPVLGAIFSSSSYLLASVVSGLLTAAAVVLALFALKRIGKEVFVIITSERYEKRHQNIQEGEKRGARS